MMYFLKKDFDRFDKVMGYSAELIINKFMELVKERDYDSVEFDIHEQALRAILGMDWNYPNPIGDMKECQKSGFKSNQLIGIEKWEVKGTKK